MKTRYSLVVLLVSCQLVAQDITVTFSATGETQAIDSIIITNLRTLESITLPGEGSLILGQGTGMDTRAIQSAQVNLYPNPFRDLINLEVIQTEQSRTAIRVFDLTGRSLCSTHSELDPGSHLFSLSVYRPGIYLVDIACGKTRQATCIHCCSSAGNPTSIHYLGASLNRSSLDLQEKKGNTDEYRLNFLPGDRLHCQGISGPYRSIITDTPDQSQTYEFNFLDCTDPDGQSYATVKIGNQYWMAENLAWLPEVDQAEEGENGEPFYYVYDYQGNDVEEARQRSHFKSYGVLYNWEAAKVSCPDGWHLPSDEEVITLETELGMAESEAEAMFDRFSGEVGKQLKSFFGWQSDGNGNNFSGFQATPGGYRYGVPNTDCGFAGTGEQMRFWTATRDPGCPLFAWCRTLYHTNQGVNRWQIRVSYGLSVRCVKDE